jgi:hypothetical protein
MFVASEIANGLFHMRLKGGVGHFDPIYTDQGKIFWQQLGSGQVVKRWHQQAFGQVSSCTKYHHRA